ncbi:hypothetical protein BDD12DRAFT_883387 [Trichophaea hybrida]|nr:hypothetical protein BDD12DRAFT_883387 [Trichophaea hybrida]
MAEPDVEPDLDQKLNSCTLTSLESTSKTVRRPINMFNAPTAGGSITGCTCHQPNKDSAGDLPSPAAQVVKKNMQAVHKEPVNHLLLTQHKKQTTFVIGKTEKYDNAKAEKKLEELEKRDEEAVDNEKKKQEIRGHMQVAMEITNVDMAIEEIADQAEEQVKIVEEMEAMEIAPKGPKASAKLTRKRKPVVKQPEKQLPSNQPIYVENPVMSAKGQSSKQDCFQVVKRGNEKTAVKKMDDNILPIPRNIFLADNSRVTFRRNKALTISQNHDAIIVSAVNIALHTAGVPHHVRAMAINTNV